MLGSGLPAALSEPDATKDAPEGKRRQEQAGVGGCSPFGGGSRNRYLNQSECHSERYLDRDQHDEGPAQQRCGTRDRWLLIGGTMRVADDDERDSAAELTGE